MVQQTFHYLRCPLCQTIALWVVRVACDMLEYVSVGKLFDITGIKIVAHCHLTECHGRKDCLQLEITAFDVVKLRLVYNYNYLEKQSTAKRNVKLLS